MDIEALEAPVTPPDDPAGESSTDPTDGPEAPVHVAVEAVSPHRRSYGKTAGQMNEEAREMYDQLPLVSRCADCPWTHEGPAVEGRAAAAAHRAAEHPERPATSRRRRPDRKLADRHDARANSAGGRSRWDEEKAMAVFRAYVEREGHPPSNSELGGGDLPTGPTVKKLFGNLGNVHVALGFPRPTSATRYKRKGGRPAAPPAAEEPEESTPPVPSADPPVPPAPEPETEEERPLPPGLVMLLYLLLRDAIPAGQLETLVLEVEAAHGKDVELSNRHLGGYALALAARLAAV